MLPYEEEFLKAGLVVKRVPDSEIKELRAKHRAKFPFLQDKPKEA